MRINPNIILLTIGVSFSIWLSASPVADAQALYDSEGRELMFDGKKLIRKPVDKTKRESVKKEIVKEETVQKEVAKKEATNPIIAKALELRPELSTPPRQKYFQSTHPYSYYNYGSYSPHYIMSDPYYRPYHHGCYNYRSIPRNGFYLNYMRGGFSIQTRF
jgi:hypothetical protein